MFEPELELDISDWLADLLTDNFDACHHEVKSMVDRVQVDLSDWKETKMDTNSWTNIYPLDQILFNCVVRNLITNQNSIRFFGRIPEKIDSVRRMGNSTKIGHWTWTTFTSGKLDLQRKAQ